MSQQYLSGDRVAHGCVKSIVSNGTLLKVQGYAFADKAFNESAEAYYLRQSFQDILVGCKDDASELDGIKVGDPIDFEIHRASDQFPGTLFARLLPKECKGFDSYQTEILKKAIALLTDLVTDLEDSDKV